MTIKQPERDVKDAQERIGDITSSTWGILTFWRRIVADWHRARLVSAARKRRKHYTYVNDVPRARRMSI